MYSVQCSDIRVTHFSFNLSFLLSSLLFSFLSLWDNLNGFFPFPLLNRLNLQVLFEHNRENPVQFHRPPGVAPPPSPPPKTLENIRTGYSLRISVLRGLMQ